MAPGAVEALELRPARLGDDAAEPELARQISSVRKRNAVVAGEADIRDVPLERLAEIQRLRQVGGAPVPSSRILDV